MGSRNVETDVIRNYINLILDMPWSIYIYKKIFLNSAILNIILF